MQLAEAVGLALVFGCAAVVRNLPLRATFGCWSSGTGCSCPKWRTVVV